MFRGAYSQESVQRIATLSYLGTDRAAVGHTYSDLFLCPLQMSCNEENIAIN